MASCVLLIVAAGCGESGGVASGATVTAYVAAALCPEAERELAQREGKAGDLRVRAICLPSVEGDGNLRLAKIGANARRATEDSSTVGYIGERTQRATRFSRPILESAEIAQLSAQPGAVAISKLLKAIEAVDTSGSLRQSVNDHLRQLP